MSTWNSDQLGSFTNPPIIDRCDDECSCRGANPAWPLQPGDPGYAAAVGRALDLIVDRHLDGNHRLALLHEAQGSSWTAPAYSSDYPGAHPCTSPGCEHTVLFDDEPYCYTHSPDEGSSVRGYSYRAQAMGSEFLG